MNTENIIGFGTSGEAVEAIRSWNPRKGEFNHQSPFKIASDKEIDEALELAESAFLQNSKISPESRSKYLEEICNQIMLLGDTLIATVMNETGFAESRVIGERARTVNQLKMFASVVKAGLWTEATLDEAIPDRQPNPKADIRKKLVPLGPVVVFTASNFPLAFSTAGGDTASALAAGNSVIVKAHEAHPATNALIAKAIQNAALICGMPDGIFATLYGKGNSLGEKLVKHPKVKAVGFTGSFNGGKALYDIANSRPEPIPVFAEMSSVNPVIILPDVLKRDNSILVKKLIGSITMGAGQFCTNPGLILIHEDENTSKFINDLGEEISKVVSSVMLTSGIQLKYNLGLSRNLACDKVEIVAQGEGSDDSRSIPTLAMVKAIDVLNDSGLINEVFGPFSLIVKGENFEEIKSVLSKLKGQLTGSLFGTEKELFESEEIIGLLQNKVGRLVINEVPTGVEVCDSMNHGGPFPATTDTRFTSVGADAIKRFARPICYQGFPDKLLPLELQNSNPLNITRKVNGELTKSSLVKLSFSES